MKAKYQSRCHNIKLSIKIELWLERSNWLGGSRQKQGWPESEQEGLLEKYQNVKPSQYLYKLPKLANLHSPITLKYKPKTFYTFTCPCFILFPNQGTGSKQAKTNNQTWGTKVTLCQTHNEKYFPFLLSVFSFISSYHLPLC